MALVRNRRHFNPSRASYRNGFVLTATNGQTIGKSQMCKSESGRNNGIDSVCRNAPDAELEADA